MAQEYGIFFIQLGVDYKPDTAEYVAYVTVQVEAFGISKRIRRQTSGITLAAAMEAVYAIIRGVAIGKGVPVPAFAGEAPEDYVPTYSGPVVYTPLLSEAEPEDPMALPAPDYDESIYGPPEEEP